MHAFAACLAVHPNQLAYLIYYSAAFLALWCFARSDDKPNSTIYNYQQYVPEDFLTHMLPLTSSLQLAWLMQSLIASESAAKISLNE